MEETGLTTSLRDLAARWAEQEQDLARQSAERKGAASARLLAAAQAIRECRRALLKAIAAPETQARERHVAEGRHGKEKRVSYDDKALAERPEPPAAEPWDSAKHVAPDPSWPVERQLHWYKVASHVLLLNCSEMVRRRAAAAADRETPVPAPTAAPAPEPATPQALAATVSALLDAAKAKDHASRTVIGVNRSQLEGEAIGLDAAAALIRERLGRPWDALAAGNARLRTVATEMLACIDSGDYPATAQVDRWRAALGGAPDA